MERFVFWALLGTVVLSPLPFGSIYPWSYDLLAIVVAVLVLLWSGAMLFNGNAPPVTLGMLKIPALLFGAVILWLVVQSAPWTPAAWHNPVWAETARILGRPVQGYISVDPFATDTSIMRLLTYAGIFWLALQFGRSSDRAKKAFYVLTIAGGVYAVYGLVVQFTGSETILWFPKERYQDALTSTFRYKNAYAAYAGITLICAIALLARALGREDFAAMGPRERMRTAITLIFDNLWYLLLCALLLATTLLLADSRGGVIAAIVAILTFVAAMRGAPGRKLPYRKTFVAILLVVGVGFLAISGGRVLDRLATSTAIPDVRSDIYHGTIQAIADRPLVGWGLGSFEGVFARYQSPAMHSRAIRAHNEYLDNALGMGIPAAFALFGAIALVGVHCARGIRLRRRNNYYPAAGLAVLVLAAVQSTVDFTFQIPAVTATWMLVLGLSTAQAWSSLVRRTARPQS